MSHQSRRTFLKCSGAALGGLFAGSTVVAAERTDRFIVRTSGTEVPSDLPVVHELPGLAYAVVGASESPVDASPSVEAYAPDVEVSLAEPEVNDAAPTAGETGADDELYPLQWDKQFLDVPSAHETTRGEGTRVAVIDSGVAAGHPDLDVNEDLSRNFTGDGFGAGIPAGGYHGTHVGGIIGASDDGFGVVGTAPATELVDCRVFSPGVLASFADIIAAMVYSASIGADAANLSIGAYPVARRAQGAFYGKVLNRAMTYVNGEGTLLCVSAGNDAADLQHDGSFISLPNEGAQACSVSATGLVGFGWDAGDAAEPPESPAYYTNYGTNAVTVAAPGGDADSTAIGTGVPWYLDLVVSTVAEPEFRYEDVDGDGEEEPVEYLGASYDHGWAAGTSMAAPQVAGAAALVKSVNPDFDANRIESVLKRTASVPDGYDGAYYGAGVVDPVAALEE
ncbi:S8 family peptidase [Halorarum salinum]|uniref:S8 family serine peptidase n=1 Tax=Halorarum salinum TaxID=2743089 RepID=A0A7D5L9R3_9EURY|nr:S8 family serine peptidase [Halobaculum salinum]QLG61646.1 S8 family serine peptidase [Halobaculum salinum]